MRSELAKTDHMWYITNHCRTGGPGNQRDKCICTHIGEYTCFLLTGIWQWFLCWFVFCYCFREDTLCFTIHFFLVHHYLLRVKPCQTLQNAPPLKGFKTEKEKSREDQL